MLAVVIHAANDLRIENWPVPKPESGQVLVRIEVGGICGSDLHYYHAGGFGTVRVRQPMALGHEIAGVVASAGPGVTGLAPGMRVAVNPSQPCNQCRYCREGMRQQCLDMRFMGSAMRMPPVEGGFRECIAIEQFQAVAIPDHLSMSEAAMAEPLAVCLHAARHVGSIQGKRVLVTGCGPIGLLCQLVARQAGALDVVATDVVDEPLALARHLGADAAVNVASDKDALSPWQAEKGLFDVVFECSGHQAALAAALTSTRPGGIIVQVGVGGDMTLPLNVLVAKEISLRGTFRFDTEFALAIEMMARGLIDVKPLISATLPARDALAAFDLASDRRKAMKVQLAFGS